MIVPGTRYTAHNLTFHSELSLPGLPSAASCVESPPDVRILFGKVDREGIVGGTRLGPCLWADRDTLWLKIPRIARFLVKEGNSILIEPEPGIDEDSIRVFLLGSALGALLFQRGCLVMHGSAIRIDGRCMICLGRSGAGKSVLAAGFMQRGHRVLADDVVPVTPEHSIVPGFPRIKLWQDAAAKLSIDTSHLRRVFPKVQKFEYPVEQYSGQEPLPVRWVYILESAGSGETIIEPIQGMARFQPLFNNTYRVEFLEGMSLGPAHIRLCGQLAGRIRMARITRPDTEFDIDTLINHILQDIKNNP